MLYTSKPFFQELTLRLRVRDNPSMTFSGWITWHGRENVCEYIIFTESLLDNFDLVSLS